MNKRTRAIKILNQFNFSGFPRAIWVIAGMNVIGWTGFNTSFTYFPLYLYQERGTPMTLVGAILLVFGILGGVFMMIGGYLGDRFGHRRIALIFSLVSVIGWVGLAASIALKAPLWSVVASTSLAQGVGAGGMPPLNAITMEVSPEGRLTESYSLGSIAGNISWAIGPLLGGYMLGFASYGWLFGFGALMAALRLIGFLFLPADTKKVIAKTRTARNWKAIIPAPAILAFSILALLLNLTETQMGSTLSVFWVNRIGFTAEQYGLLMSISGILIIILQYPVSHAVAQRLRTALVLGCLFYAFGFLSLAWVKAFVPALGSIAAMVIAEMLFIPTASAAVGQMTGPEDRGKAMGFYGLCSTTGMSIGPIIGGFLLDKYPGTPLLIWGPVSLFSFVAALGFGVWKGYAQDKEIM